MPKRITIHTIECEIPQESGDGDEMWARLTSGGQKVLSPASGNSHWDINPGRPLDVNMSVDLSGQAVFQIWDSDSFFQTGPVERRDNELLTEDTFFETDPVVSNDRRIGSAGSGNKGARYWFTYSITAS